MKKKIVFVTICLLLNSCKSHYFYSWDKKNALINTGLFQVEIRIKSFLKGERDELNVGLYIDSSAHSIVEKSIKIYPVIEKNRDTLKFISEYDYKFRFEFYKEWPEKIDVNIRYDIDSLGFVSHKLVSLNGLRKSSNLTYGFATH